MKTIYILFYVANDYNQPEKAFEKLFWQEPSLEDINNHLNSAFVHLQYHSILNGKPTRLERNGYGIDADYWIEKFEEPKKNNIFDKNPETGEFYSVERLQKHLDSPEGKKMALKYQQEELVKELQEKRIELFFNNLSEEQIEQWIPKFLKWEEKYEEFWYSERHTQTSSMIFSILMDIIEKRGKPIKNLKEDFLSNAFKWNGYSFRLFCGQGCFWRITKGKKQIFQST